MFIPLLVLPVLVLVAALSGTCMGLMSGQICV